MAHSCVTCVALGLAQHQLPLRSNCCHHHSHRRHHQQADLDAPCFLSSARAMLFQLFQVGLPAASSWVLPAPLSHPCDPSRARGLSCSLSAFFPRCLAMVGGKRSSSSVHSCHSVACITRCSAQREILPKPSSPLMYAVGIQVLAVPSRILWNCPLLLIVAATVQGWTGRNSCREH